MGMKVWVELDWEQLDSIICTELKSHIIMCHTEIQNDMWLHPDDKLDSETLFPALWRVYEYWAGNTEVKELKKELGYADSPA